MALQQLTLTCRRTRRYWSSSKKLITQAAIAVMVHDTLACVTQASMQKLLLGTNPPTSQSWVSAAIEEGEAPLPADASELLRQSLAPEAPAACQ